MRAASRYVPRRIDLGSPWPVAGIVRFIDIGKSQIGAVLVSKDGKVLGRGRNKRVQEGNNILHVG